MTKLLGSTPWQHVRVKKVSTRAHSGGSYAKPDEVAGEYSLAARPCHEGLDQSTQPRQLCEASCGILAPRQRRHQPPDHVLSNRGLSCLCTALRSQFCAILRASLLARGSLGRHATALDKKAAWASPLACVTRPSA